MYFNTIIHGVSLTILLMIASLLVGFVLACVVVLLQISSKPYLKIPAQIYVFIIRGTPLLVQIFIIYYGSAEFPLIRDSFMWTILKNPFGCAVLALAINTSAYTSVLIHGAINSIAKADIEACQSLGMSMMLMLRRHIFPQAIRIALPAYSNEVIIVLKSTSLTSTITVMDLMGVTRQIAAQTYETIPFLLLAGVIYLSLNLLIMWIFKTIEAKNAYPT